MCLKRYAQLILLLLFCIFNVLNTPAEVVASNQSLELAFSKSTNSDCYGIINRIYTENVYMLSVFPLLATLFVVSLASLLLLYLFFNLRLSLNILCVVFECMSLVTATIRTSVSPLCLQTNIFTPTSICTEARFNRRHETLNDAHTTHSIHSKRTETRTVYPNFFNCGFRSLFLSLSLSRSISSSDCFTLYTFVLYL